MLSEMMAQMVVSLWKRFSTVMEKGGMSFRGVEHVTQADPNSDPLMRQVKSLMMVTKQHVCLHTKQLLPTP